MRTPTTLISIVFIALISGCNTGLTYNLEVNGAKGSGQYRPGREKALKITNIPEGMIFEKWSGGAGYVKDVYSPETTVLIPGRDITIKAEFRDKESCGIADIDRIREEVRSSATTESNGRARHAVLRRWWRLLWRQGYDMSAFEENSWILLTRWGNTPEMIQAIDQGFSILEDLFSNPVYIAEVAGTANVVDPDGQSENGIKRTNWPFYHGVDGAQTGYSPDVGPSEGKLAWHFPKLNQATPPPPILRDGRVYISRLNYSLDEVTGERIEAEQTGKDARQSWEQMVRARSYGNRIALFKNKEILWEKELGTELRGEPAVYSERLYIGNSKGKLFALDISDGSVLWSYEADEITGAAYQYYSAPAESGDRIFIGGAGSMVYCLDASEGSLLWKYKVSDWVRSKPLVIGDMVYVATMDGNLYALRDGGSQAEEIRKVKLNEHGFTTNLAGSEKGILAAGKDMILYSVFPETFYLNWKQGIVDGAWVDGKFYRIKLEGGPPSLTVVDGILYCGGKDQFVHALDAETGEEIWRFETGGRLGAAITVAENMVFFGFYGGKGVYYALDKNTGKLIWQTEEYGNVWVGAQYNAGKLFFGNMQGMMYGVDAASGKMLWSYDTAKDTEKENWRNMNVRTRHGWPPGIYPVPVADASKVYIGSWSGYYFAFDQETGKMVWRTQTNNGNLNGGLPDSAAPVLWGNYVYVQKTGNIIAALNRETGKIEWEWNAPRGYGQNGTVAAHDNKIFGSYFDGGRAFPYNATIIAFDDVEHGSAELWRCKGGGGLTAPVITDGKLINVSSADPFMVCLDPEDGSVIWRIFTGGVMLEGVPAIYGNKVYAYSDTDWIYAIQ
ncbi:PQQ-binding-like beta-propeller repeat protein [Bacteroidota bacterium]